MPRRKLEDKNIRKLGKVGGGKSMCVTLPIDLVRKLGWKSKQKNDSVLCRKPKLILDKN